MASTPQTTLCPPHPSRDADEEKQQGECFARGNSASPRRVQDKSPDSLQFEPLKALLDSPHPFCRAAFQQVI